MQDPFLLDATASEPLTMEQEIKMQQEWRDDECKCTFIILARDLLSPGSCSDGDDNEVHIPPAPINKGCNEEQLYPKLIDQTLHAMIGDINLFLSQEEEEIDLDDYAIDSQHCTEIKGNPTTQLSQAELDIMIARSSHRHKGLGAELALTMMHYGASALGIRRFFVKIKDSNTSSLKLFRDKLEFIECAYAQCFSEYEFECKKETADAMVKWIEDKWERLRTDICSDEEAISSKLYDVYNCPLNEQII